MVSIGSGVLIILINLPSCSGLALMLVLRGHWAVHFLLDWRHRSNRLLRVIIDNGVVLFLLDRSPRPVDLVGIGRLRLAVESFLDCLSRSAVMDGTRYGLTLLDFQGSSDLVMRGSRAVMFLDCCPWSAIVATEHGLLLVYLDLRRTTEVLLGANDRCLLEILLSSQALRLGLLLSVELTQGSVYATFQVLRLLFCRL